ncbi:MAG: hypothetical protein ABSF32_01015 [Ignavibacteria bacterium]
MKKQHDVKFIIYQSLYIFVVCVVAIKGANLNLTQVVEDDGKPKPQITMDSLEKLYDVMKKMVMVDTNYFVVVDKKLLAENENLKRIVENMPKIDIANFMPKTEVLEKYELKKEKPEEKKDPNEMQEIRIGSISLTQFTLNTLNNPYDVPLEIVGITSIPPKSTKTFETGGQSSVVIRVGNSSKTVELKPNEKPKISFQRIATMNEDTRVTDLQRNVGYRVTITDDFPGQLDVKFTGPVTIKQAGATTYDITMNAFSSKAAFDNFTENKSAPYSLGFTVTVTDKIAGHKITGQNSFVFGDW